MTLLELIAGLYVNNTSILIKPDPKRGNCLVIEVKKCTEDNAGACTVIATRTFDFLSPEEAEKVIEDSIFGLLKRVDQIAASG